MTNDGPKSICLSFNVERRAPAFPLTLREARCYTFVTNQIRPGASCVTSESGVSFKPVRSQRDSSSLKF